MNRITAVVAPRARLISRLVGVAALTGILSTCDLLSEPGLSGIVITFTSDTTLIVGTTISPAISVSVDGTAQPDPRIQLTSSDNGVVVITADGDSLRVVGRGRATVRITLIGATLGDEPPFFDQPVRAVAAQIVTDTASIVFASLNDTLGVRADPLDAVGSVIANTTIAWESTDDSVATVDAAGRIVSRGNGTAEIRALVDDDTATVAVTVAQVLADWGFAPPGMTLSAIGAESTFVLTALDARANPIVTGVTVPTVTWTTGDNAVADVDATGRVTAISNGATKIFVSAGGVEDSAGVAVDQRATLVQISGPDTVRLTSIQDSIRLTVFAFDGRGTSVLNAAPTWKSLDLAVAQVGALDGIVRALGLGTADIEAELDGQTDVVTVVVTNEPRTVDVTPDTALITTIGDVVQFVATVRNGLGDQLPGTPVTWQSLDTTIVAMNVTGLATARLEGTVQVVGTVSATIADTSIVVIRDQPVTINIVPATATLASVADTVIPAVDFRNAAGDPLPRTAVDWSTSNGSVASVTNDGTIIATGRGNADIRATNPFNVASSDIITVTVTNAPVSIDVFQTDDTLPSLERTQLYAASIRNARGGIVPDTVNWISRAPAIAQIASTGAATAIATAKGIGTVFIVGSAGPVLDSARLTVSNNANSVTLSPTFVSFASIGDAVTLTATVLNELGNVITSPTIAWAETSAGTVVTVSGTGVVTAVGEGSATVSATVDGVTASIPVSVADEPTSIAFTSLDTTLASSGDSYSPGLTIVNGRGTTLPRAAADWTTTDVNVATVSGSGLVTAQGAGAATITATSPFDGSVTDAIVVTVTNAPASITINRTDTTLTAIGRTLQFSAEVRNAAGGLIPGAIVTWSSSTAAVSVTAGGLATADGVGASTVTGTTTNALPASAVVTVTNNAVQVSVVPQTDTIIDLSATLQLSVVALNDMGLSLPASQITWSFLDPGIATVNATGLVTPVGTGDGRIVVQDNIGGMSDQAVITVVDAPQTIVVNNADTTLASLGDGFTVDVTITSFASSALPSTDVVWATSAPNVATVTDAGVVAAVGRGTATISATSPFDQSITDGVTVTVTNAPVGVQLNRTDDTLTAIGRTLDYTAVVVNAAGDPIPSETVTWEESSTGTVVTITQAGIVTGVGVGGPTTITARVDSDPTNIFATAVVRVRNDAASVTLNPSGAPLSLTALTETVALTATPRNDLGNPIAGLAISWNSTDPSIVTAPAGSGQAGNATAVGVGSATVTASALIGAGPDSVTASVTITVTNDPSSIVFSSADTTLTSLGDSYIPGITIDNAAPGLLPNTAADWSSSDLAVVTVAADGTITAQGVGAATVTAASPSDAGVSDAITVTVTNVPATVVINTSGAPDTLTAIGQSLTFTATVRNGAGNIIPGAAVTWNSSDASVSIGTTDGVTTAAAASGTASITATSGLITSAGVPLAVVNPTALYVDKDASVSPSHGTIKRPYATIQNAADAATTGDTLFISAATTSYQEAVSLTAGVVLQGIDTVAAGCTETGCTSPALLPTIGHAFGAAGITPASNTSVTIRHLAVQHSVDGPALDADNAEIDAAFFYVNPTDPGTPTGRGILIRNVTVTDSARIRHSTVQHVNGYGIRLENVIGMRIDSVVTRRVASAAGIDVGAGIHVTGAGAASDTVFRSRLTQNTVGVRFGTTVGAMVFDTNDVFDNDSLGAADLPGSNAHLNNWWGDGRGPRRDLGSFTTPADTAATGDTVVFAGGFTPTYTGNVRAAPLTGVSSGADTLFIVRGDNQGTTSPPPVSVNPDTLAFNLTVRVVDAQGLPVSGVTVTFDLDDSSSPTCDTDDGATDPADDDIDPGTANNQCSVAVVTDASGLSEANIHFGDITGPRTVIVSAAGITATAQFDLARN